VHLVVAALRWQDEQATCTPLDTAVPPPPPGRRIAVLVGGLGSATGDAAVLHTDTASLGYDRQDVLQFSYRSDGRPFTAPDTEGDLDRAAQRLAAQVGRLAAGNPGVPIDLIAHSQGGLVARAAVVLHGARPAVLATLGTPHHGADLATAEVGLHLTDSGSQAIDAASRHLTKPRASLDLDQTSIHQLSETSSFIRRLDRAPLPSPSTTRTISIAVRGDPVVPNHQSRLAGPATNTVITTTGALNEHTGLPGASATTVELLRALAGQGPTCRSLVDALADETIGRQVSQLQDQGGAALTAVALYADARVRHSIRSP
jgi:pimeloyl-ACP methyl ester carboxylesterase